MICTVTGIEHVEWTDEQTNKVNSGDRVYFQYEDPSVSGSPSDVVWLASDTQIKHPALVAGVKYDFIFQFRGFKKKQKLVEIRSLNSK